MSVYMPWEYPPQCYSCRWVYGHGPVHCLYGPCALADLVQLGCTVVLGSQPIYRAYHALEYPVPVILRPVDAISSAHSLMMQACKQKGYHQGIMRVSTGTSPCLLG